MPDRPPTASELQRVVRSILRDRSPVVLVDGPSGAGKSTFADRLVRELRRTRTVQLVRMDDHYPGWSGLEPAGVALHDGLLLPRSRGVDGALRRWNWGAGTAGSMRRIAADDSVLVVEGCGAATRDNVGLATRVIWVTADDAERRDRALRRDGDLFAGHWEEWDRAFRRFVSIHRPEASADHRLITTTRPAAPR